MENESKQVVPSGEEKTTKENINRKEALIRAGKYAAVTALGTMILLSPKKSQAGSSSPGGPGDWPPSGKV